MHRWSVNEQNSRIWAIRNPECIHSLLLHSVRVTVWRAITAQEFIGAYFFENLPADYALIVASDSENYLNMQKE